MLLFLTALLGLSLSSVAQYVPDFGYESDIDRFLAPRLSKGASIVHSTSAVPRWSDYAAPRPRTVINVATEEDVALTVQYCMSRRLKFLAQNGGNGWAKTFTIDKKDVLINLRALNSVDLSDDKKSIAVGGGALVADVIKVAAAAGVQVQVGNCNCIGALGATLGGGYGHLAGQYGLAVDNLLSVNMVTGRGKLITVTPEEKDLWWAIRGAGPNFGIVTSAIMKAHPVANTTAWLGPLIFTPEKIEVLVQAMNDLTLTPRMSLFLFFGTSGPPSFTPSVFVLPYYGGSAAEGKAAFSSIYALGPVIDQTAEVPYDRVNSGSDIFCTKGGRKPTYSAGLATAEPRILRETWNEYLKFLENPGTGNSLILLEGYPVEGPIANSDSAAASPLRSVKFHAIAITWYNDTSLDPVAEAFGSKVRDMWYASNGLGVNKTYINFAHGDENLETVYGSSLGRLKEIKKKWDPQGKFNQWFPLK